MHSNGASSGRNKDRASRALTEVVGDNASRRRRQPTYTTSKGAKIPRYEIKEVFNEEYTRRLNERSRRLTLCLICLVGAVASLSPFLSIHLTRRIGLLLFESELVQLRSSLFSVILCSLILVILYVVLLILSYNESARRRGLIMQRLLKQFIGLFAVISAISYLSLALLVPRIKQVQRMPIATFDCNANLITIENCHQQFTTRGGEQSVSEAMGQLFTGDLGDNSHNDRLIRRLNCIQYNDNELNAFKVPSRFLLHHCGLVCRPQRQQLHQFGDDLNKEQQQLGDSLEFRSQPTKTTLDSLPPNSRLIPPYHHAVKDLRQELEAMEGTQQQHIIYHNRSSILEGRSDRANEISQSSGPSRQVSMRVCFSSDFNSGGSNYKQFCITNLANTDHHQDDTLTVGQLNAMLRKFAPASARDKDESNNQESLNSDYEPRPPSTEEEQTLIDEQLTKQAAKSTLVEDQTTHYVNPVVQFESHFKNWPHLTHRATSSSLGDSGEDNDESSEWCQFRPIPPFIVNNKPFNDIQCSLEHEYTMTTGPQVTSQSGGGDSRLEDRIYLKKSSSGQDGGEAGESRTTSTFGAESYSRERCNIQCKVNILYQIQANKRSRGRGKQKSSGIVGDEEGGDLHYYLPLKPCIMISGDGDKALTSYYYLLFRSLGDSTLLLAFILIDLFLLLEVIDTKQYMLGSKKYRFIGLLLVLTLAPLMVSLLFDLITIYSPTYFQVKSKRDNHLSSFLFDRLLPSLVELFSTSSSSSSSLEGAKRKLSSTNVGASYQQQPSTNLTSPDLEQNPDRPTATAYGSLDGYMAPFFIYSILMFILAINSWTIPLVSSMAPLNRVSSVEELGMTNVGSSGSINKLNSANRSATTNKRSPSPEGGGHQRSSPELNEASQPKTPHKLNRKLAIKLISFILLAMFMGIQFNLSQLTQTQILMEAFGDPSAAKSGKELTATWFILATKSGAAFFLLLLALIFSDEASTFFTNSFLLFNTTHLITTPTSTTTNGQKQLAITSAATAIEDSETYDDRQRQAKFLKYISLAQLVYSVRYFGLLNLNSSSRFRWALIFMFQVAEIFNFPVVWFILTCRIHQLVAEHPAYIKYRLAKSSNLEPASGSKILNFHILCQSALAMLYFVLCRYFALFIHSLHASLHLHSENVDWFIYSFYQQKLAAMQPNNQDLVSKQQQGDSEAQNRSRNGLNNQPEADPQRLSGGESLFSPLPGERQTYLYATRLFLKYNSIICLITGSYFLLNQAYIHYQIWSTQKRTLNVSRQKLPASKANTNQLGTVVLSSEDFACQQIDDQLSLDLMRIRQSSSSNNITRLIHPNHEQVVGGSDKRAAQRIKSNSGARSPRAKILFQYNLGRQDSSNDEDHLQELPSPVQQESRSPTSITSNQEELRIPVGFEDEDQPTNPNNLEDRRHLAEVSRRTDSKRPELRHEAPIAMFERIVQHRSKKVRIFEDEEEWPPEDPFHHSASNNEYDQDAPGSALEENKEEEQEEEEKEEVGERRDRIVVEDRDTGMNITYSRPHKRPTRVAKIPAASSGTRDSTKIGHRRRTITFAPKATLIGHDGFRAERSPAVSSSQSGASGGPRYASPEPSIDSNDGDDSDQNY